VKLWASAFGGEMKSISAKYSGSQLLQKVSRGNRLEIKRGYFEGYFYSFHGMAAETKAPLS
jgi:hypothetical protein